MSEREQRPSWLADTLGNRPFVVSVLYLSCFFLPLMLVVAVPLAFIFRRGPSEEWETSHYRYLTRTFWLAFGCATIVLVLGLTAISMMESKQRFRLPARSPRHGRSAGNHCPVRSAQRVVDGLCRGAATHAAT